MELNGNEPNKDQPSINIDAKDIELKSDDHLPSSSVMKFFEKLCFPILYPLSKLMPVEKFPELSFMIIVIIYFISTDFILKVVSVMSVYTNLPQIFVGLTVMSWGSSAIELINMSIAMKKGNM
jgi:Ca2+/Na+ antiporter